jgi:hypothetical protein
MGAKDKSWRWGDEAALQERFPGGVDEPAFGPPWVVPGVIPGGLVALAGRPFIGKSWLALQIAGAVGTGGRVFDRQVRKGKVLFLALLDPPRRLQMRGRKQLWPAEVDVTFVLEWPPLGQGGTAALRQRIEEEGCTLVIVDPLIQALGAAGLRDRAATTRAAGELQRLARELDVTVLVLSADPLDEILGSTGKPLPLDAVCELYRERGTKEGLLRVRGPGREEVELALTFDGQTCTWAMAHRHRALPPTEEGR